MHSHFIVMDSRDTERGHATGEIVHEYENMDPNEDYDAFNEDTFGNDVETWTKEGHDQLVGVHATEVIKSIKSMVGSIITFSILS